MHRKEKEKMLRDEINKALLKLDSQTLIMLTSKLLLTHHSDIVRKLIRELLALNKAEWKDEE